MKKETLIKIIDEIWFLFVCSISGFLWYWGYDFVVIGIIFWMTALIGRRQAKIYYSNEKTNL